jgi:hypothetical protein
MIQESIWGRNMLMALRHIADEVYQRRAWFGVGPEVSSPTEMINELYDDCRLLDFIKCAPSYISIETLHALRRLDAQLEDVDVDDTSAADLMESPIWGAVRMTAQKAAQRLEGELRPN